MESVNFLGICCFFCQTEGEKVRSGVNVTDLLQKEEVDSLTYLDWQHDHAQETPEETETEEESIEDHSIMQDYEECDKFYEDDEYEDLNEDNAGYAEIANAKSRSIADESESDDDMGFGLWDDESNEEAEYDEPPAKAEQERSRDGLYSLVRGATRKERKMRLTGKFSYITVEMQF